MSSKKLRSASHQRERSWAPFTGDFALLKDFLSEKDTIFGSVLRLLDALLRGFAQVVFLNNPLSGLFIIIGLGTAIPEILAFSAVTGFLGLLLSMLTRDSQDIIENGMTVYNPLLIGAISYVLIPKIYGNFDAFSFLLVLLGTIFSVYLARSLGSNKIPCITWPFNLAEYVLIFALTIQNDADTLSTFSEMNNTTSDAATGDVSSISQNATDIKVNWGMVFRGVVVSASQVYAVDNVIAASLIYLGSLIFSPITAGFSLLGALIGTLAGIQLGVPYEEVFTGVWGYNSFLTGAALGGNLFVINAQTAAATLVAIVYTVAVQYGLQNLFKRIQLPILTLPFVVATTLFLKLRNSSEDSVFPQPIRSSYPEKQRSDYIKNRRDTALPQEDD